MLIAQRWPINDRSGGLPPWLDQGEEGAWLLRVKAVPGASRDAIAGELGDRLKIRVAAPPEAGKANKAICKLIAARLGVKRKDVEILSGGTSPLKCIRIKNLAVVDPHSLIDQLL